MIKLNMKELKKIIITYYEHKLPLMITGGYGIGKSEGIIQVAKYLAPKENREYAHWNEISEEKKLDVEKHPEKYFIVIDQRLTENDVSDLKGIPRLTESYCDWKVQRWLRLLCMEGIKGILLFDELNLANPDVQASAYKIINERFINDVKLSSGVTIIGCGNRAQDEAHVVEMPRPLRNRMGEVELEFTNQSFIDYARNQNFNSTMFSFLSTFKKDRVLRVGKELNGPEDVATTSRSWFKASKLVGTNDVCDCYNLIATAIGEVVASELIAYAKQVKTFDLKIYLQDPRQIKKVNALSDKHSIICALAELYRTDETIFDTLIKICDEAGAEYGMLLLRNMRQNNKEHFEDHIFENELYVEKLMDEYNELVIEKK